MPRQLPISLRSFQQVSVVRLNPEYQSFSHVFSVVSVVVLIENPDCCGVRGREFVRSKISTHEVKILLLVVEPHHVLPVFLMGVTLTVLYHVHVLLSSKTSKNYLARNSQELLQAPRTRCRKSRFGPQTNAPLFYEYCGAFVWEKKSPKSKENGSQPVCCVFEA